MIGGIGISMEEHCNNSVVVNEKVSCEQTIQGSSTSATSTEFSSSRNGTISNDESTGRTTTINQPHVGVLSPCRDSMERNSFSMGAMRASLTATANNMP